MELIITWGVRIISAIAILVAGWVIGNWTSDRVEKLPKIDPMLATFLGGFVKYGIFAIALVTVLSQFGIQTASFLAVLGAAGLAIGLALQGTLSNVASGVMLLILRPFKVGDYIEFAGIGGTVKALTLFTTELVRADNVAIFAPNSSVWNAQIYNFSRHPFRSQDISIAVSYETDIDKAIRTAKNVLDNSITILKEADKGPQVLVTQFGETSVTMVARFWTRSEDYWATRWQVNKAIKEAFEKENICSPAAAKPVFLTQDEKAKAA